MHKLCSFLIAALRLVHRAFCQATWHVQEVTTAMRNRKEFLPCLYLLPGRLVGCSLLFLPLHVFAQPGVHNLTTRKLTDSIYVFEPNTQCKDIVDGNVTAIIGSKGVVLVDVPQRGPFVKEVTKRLSNLTSLPVAYIVITHWHNDHSSGLVLLRKVFPGAKLILQTENAIAFREKLYPTMMELRNGDTATINLFRRDLAAGTKFGKAPFANAYERKRWGETLKDDEEMVADYRGFDEKLLEPDIVFGDTLRIRDGGLDVELTHIPSSHSPSDIFVFVPSKNILITGDIVVAPVPYAFNAKHQWWMENLERIRQRKPTVMVPGHGAVQYDFGYIDKLDSLLKTLQQRTNERYTKGMTLDDLIKAVDMQDVKQHYINTNDPEQNYAFDAYFVTPAVRTYFRELSK